MLSMTFTYYYTMAVGLEVIRLHRSGSVRGHREIAGSWSAHPRHHRHLPLAGIRPRTAAHMPHCLPSAGPETRRAS